MAKQGIHPVGHKINIRLTSGDIIQVTSTYGKPGDELRLDIDPLKHPAWNKDGAGFINENADKIAKFKSKYGGFSLGGKKEEAPKADAAKDGSN